LWSLSLMVPPRHSDCNSSTHIGLQAADCRLPPSLPAILQTAFSPWPENNPPVNYCCHRGLACHHGSRLREDFMLPQMAKNGSLVINMAKSSGALVEGRRACQALLVWLWHWQGGLIQKYHSLGICPKIPLEDGIQLCKYDLAGQDECFSVRSEIRRWPACTGNASGCGVRAMGMIIDIHPAMISGWRNVAACGDGLNVKL